MGAPHTHQSNLLPMILIISLDGWRGPSGYKQGGRHNRWKKLSPWNPRRNRHHIPPWTGVSKKWESTVQEPEDGILPFSQGCLLSRVGFLVDLYLSIFFSIISLFVPSFPFPFASFCLFCKEQLQSQRMFSGPTQYTWTMPKASQVSEQPSSDKQSTVV